VIDLSLFSGSFAQITTKESKVLALTRKGKSPIGLIASWLLARRVHVEDGSFALQ
jgi:hypothetical protein